jgi:hypothetical protein
MGVIIGYPREGGGVVGLYTYFGAR